MVNSTVRQIIYGIIAVLGAVLTWKNNLAWMFAQSTPPSLIDFWTEAFGSHVAASLAWDIVIAGTAGFVLVLTETRRLGMKKYWPVIYLVCGNMIAAAFALPLFLLFRERHMDAGASSTPG